MANLIDYIQWRGDLDFEISPLNPVDFMIFSQLSYLPFDDIVPAPEEKEGINLGLALEILLEKLNESNLKQESLLTYKEEPDFINAVISSARFRNCHLLGYVNKIDINKELQFSAVCIYIDKKTSVIIYRGTDTTFIGWKENFNMAFKEIIPAQQEAAAYLEQMGAMLKDGIYITGHSKGGNLAIYGASFCSNKIQKKILGIYSYDAPGFHETVINSDGYLKIKNKIHFYIPESSIIGLLLEHSCDYKVVKSMQVGFLQHFLFTWEVTCNDLVQTENTNLSSRFIDKTIREWINSWDNSQREQFVEGVYKILCSSEIKTVKEMEQSWLLTLGRMVKSIGNVDESTRKHTLKIFADLFRTAGRNLDILFKKDPK